MKTATLTLLAALALLGGCATCQQHPLACGIVTAVVVGSVAATIAAHDHDHRVTRPQSMSNTQPTNCASNPALCQ